MTEREKKLETALDSAVAVCRAMALRLTTERPVASEELSNLVDEWEALLGLDHG